ncbi:Uncharacterised protein [Legionella beliardensis]|uniref:Uncharacterized protein n=1 Tax=Legionella beliardensis TaxID=91822 RepID=A0A378I6J8_9GAMM|nr:hypothetical protein [Legionella beliardensis]STX28084.1 Uncharacterised protein [Legionella beliardensis]
MSTSIQEITKFILNEHEINDFFKSHRPTFETIDEEKAKGLVSMLAEGHSYSTILRDHFDDDLDQLAKSAAYAFSIGAINREQVSSILEFREMQLGLAGSTFTAVNSFDFFDANNELTSKAADILPHFLSSEDKDKFLALLKDKPRSEQCFYIVKIPAISRQSIGIRGLLELGHELKIIKKSRTPVIQANYEGIESDEQYAQDKEDVVTVTIFSVGARDALTKAIYGEHAKSIFPSLGKFSIDDIKNSIRSHGRYAAVSYPGVEDTISFHLILARVFYSGMHDEAHRRLISSIPNPAYKALIAAVDVIRSQTDIEWSKDIWDTIDMEVGEFLTETQAYRNQTSPDAITSMFARLLNARVFTQDRPMGLLTDSPLIETTWLLMLDIVLNKEKWQALSIDANFFPEASFYKKIIDFIEANKQVIVHESSPAKQVAMLMARYFNLPTTALDNIKFEKQERYVQLVKDDKPFFIPKSLALALSNMGDYQAIFIAQIRKGDLHFSEMSNEQWQRLSKRIQLNQKINPNLNTLLAVNGLKIKDILDFTDEKFEFLISNRIINLLEKDRITIQEFKALNTKDSEHLAIKGVYKLFKNNKITYQEFKELTDKDCERLKEQTIFALLYDNKITFQEFKALNDTNCKRLKNLNLSKLLYNNSITFEELKALTEVECRHLYEDSIFNLVYSNKISLQELRELSASRLINNLKVTAINALVLNGELSINRFKLLTDAELTNLVHDRIRPLLFNGILTFQRFEVLHASGLIEKIKGLDHATWFNIIKNNLDINEVLGLNKLVDVDNSSQSIASSGISFFATKLKEAASSLATVVNSLPSLNSNSTSNK